MPKLLLTVTHILSALLGALAIFAAQNWPTPPAA